MRIFLLVTIVLMAASPAAAQSKYIINVPSRQPPVTASPKVNIGETGELDGRTIACKSQETVMQALVLLAQKISRPPSV
jgi:hypothetical protein